MTFAAHTIDPRWHHRRPVPRRIGKREGVQFAAAVEPGHYDHASVVARALPFSAGATAFSHPAAEAIAQEKDPDRSNRRGLALRLSRVEGAPFGRVEDLKVGRGADVPATGATQGMCARTAPLPPRDAGEKGWKEGLLGYGARVLALSVSSSKRELLCDRKDPYLHLTPRRLAFTVVKSGFVVAAPMINEVILENLDEDEDQPPARRPNQGGAGGFGGGGLGNVGAFYDPGTGRLVFDRELDEVEVEDEGEEAADVMKSLSKSFELFPALTFRRVLHSVMTVSTQRLLEWQAVMRLSARTADRLTKNIALSALRKTERMSRGMAAAKMTLTAGKSLFFQNLALFIVDELFLSVRVYLRERHRRKENPYACTDWPAVMREMRQKSLGNASFAFCIWMAGTLGTVAGTLVYPARGPELLSILAEMGASALLN